MMKSAIAALIATSVSACDNGWIWEECSWSWYRDACDYENVDCGWIYWDDWDQSEFVVTCATFDTWVSCQ